jgi:hypothetical protein
MRKFILTAFLVLFLGSAQAQSVPPELKFRFGVGLLLLPAIQLGLEVGNPIGGFGIRLQMSPFIWVNRFAVEAYVFTPLSPDWEIYFGGGTGLIIGPFSFGTEHYYGMLGVRLKQGFYLEVTPGVFQGYTCTGGVPVNGAAQARTPPCGVSQFSRTFVIYGTLGFSWRF